MNSLSVRRLVCLTAFSILLMTLPRIAGAQQPGNADLWEDFGHYVIIAQPELARDSWLALEGRVTDAELLDIVESLPEYSFDRFRGFVLGNDLLRPIGIEIDRRLTAATLERVNDPERIARAIDDLGRGQRPNLRATRFLVSAGQNAVPALLATLTDDSKRELHPYISRAMLDMGRSVSYPLSVSLPHLESIHQVRVAQILGELGYTDALPYLAEIIENRTSGETARQAAGIALAMIAKANRLSESPRAAEWYLWQAQRFYRAGTLNQPVNGYEERADHGRIWTFRPDVGLLGVTVPANVHADIRALHAAGNALRLDATLSEAVTVMLAANSRRQIRLDGAADESYPFEQPAEFYLRLAGPAHQLPVLRMAISDQETELARFALAALTDTGSLAAMLSIEGQVRPMLTALSHPNRRIRFEAALALARTHPRDPFEQAHRVVPVLSEAVKQSGQRFAVIISQDEESLNQAAARLDELRDYRIIRGPSLTDVLGDVRHTPGVDLLVVIGNSSMIAATYVQATADYRMAATPVVAVTTSLDWSELEARHGQTARMVHADNAGDEPTGAEAVFNDAIRRAIDLGEAGRIEPLEAQGYAIEALLALREIALTRNPVFRIGDAQQVLIESLRDPRTEVARGGGRCLALIESDDAQRALAAVAMDDQIDETLRISLLGSLAESANLHGNRLTSAQMHRLREMVERTRGDLAIEAARALGALTPPTTLLRESLKLSR
ncbi:MAG: hypothetical protein JJU36_08315 [Phycisphaeraceae bacterium]|nr:hypothetical protein [Phycisphaeraceae bacterium]